MTGQLGLQTETLSLKKAKEQLNENKNKEFIRFSFSYDRLLGWKLGLTKISESISICDVLFY